jgi:hypothetical protein
MKELDDLVGRAVEALHHNITILELAGKLKEAPQTHLLDAAADARARLDRALGRWGKSTEQSA